MSTFLYFAYGSNMSKRRLKKRVCSAKVIGTGVLCNHLLTFNKFSRKDRSGKCTIECAKSDKVYGVLFEINEDQECCLDAVEGVSKGNSSKGGYKKIKVDIKIIETREPKKYKCGETVCGVKTYQATKPCQNLKPYTWYKKHVLVGAKEQNLPQRYIDYLKSFDAVKDYCKKREECELSIYKSSQC